MEVTRLDVALGPSLSVSEASPSSSQMLGNMHISPNLQVPPRLVVVNPTPNLTPHPTPPAFPLSASGFTSASSSALDSTFRNNNQHGFGDTKGNLLTLPPDCYPNQIRDPTAVTPTEVNLVSSLSFSLAQLSQPLTHLQSVDEDQLLTSQSFVQDLEISANFNSNSHSISSTTTIASVMDCIASAAISTAIAASSVFLDEASEVEEPRKTVNDSDVSINDAPVAGSPVKNKTGIKEEGQDENETVEKKFSEISDIYAFAPTTNSSSSINLFVVD